MLRGLDENRVVLSLFYCYLKMVSNKRCVVPSPSVLEVHLNSKYICLSGIPQHGNTLQFLIF